MNRGLILLSPVILVRLLTVEDFGRYREFLLYAGLLSSIASFSINSSLLRFMPDNPRSNWHFVDQAVIMTLISSLLVAGGLLALNTALDGRLVGDYAVPVALYVVFYVNVDFWEALYLAEKRSFAVLRYTTVRLVARITVVTVAAALTRDVNTIIAALVSLEAVRLLISTVAWRVRARASSSEGGEPRRWRDQLQYCMPFGAAMILVTLNRSMGSLFVAQALGPVALAHYTIGTYLNPIISVIRNSLSDVVLPEMASTEKASQADPLALWRRTTVVTAMLLIPIGVLLARFAEIIVVTLFSAEFLPAVVLFRIYVAVFLREAVDFSIPLRVKNRTPSILQSNLVAIGANVLLMLTLVPLWGAAGAVAALVASRFVEGVFLAWQTALVYEIRVRSLAPWMSLAKVIVAASVSTIPLYGDFWTQQWGVLGAMLGGAVYMLTFVAILLALRVSEAQLFLRWLAALRRLAPANRG